MEIEFNQEELAFRDEVREFLKNDYPSHVKEKQDLGSATLKTRYD